MKRDMDLIREILFMIETSCNGDQPLIIPVARVAGKFPKITQSVLDEHIQLLTERKLIEAEGTQFQ
jgi:hypothetical protein